ncbi:15420_t:CDS:10 [Rhizophagus irregularis]|nr:15420_t:CDS:10 [Rhizophagus irregularis]
MNFPDHVLFNINVAVVAMILRKRYGYEFERDDDSKSIKSNEMWEMTETLHNILIDCLGTDDAILDFINWFFDGIRKTFESENNFSSRNNSSFSLQHHHQILVFPDTCFQYFLRWVDFSAFTDMNQIGKGGFSEVYVGKCTNDRLDGTLKQWVTNMECQIILNYVQCRNEDLKEDFEDIPLEKWENILSDFVDKMKLIYRDRKALKCKPRDLSDENQEHKVKRTNSFTRLKSLLKRRPSKKKNKNPKKKITQIPSTVSPLRSKFVPKTVVLKRLLDSQNLSSSFINEIKTHYLSLKKSSKVPRMYGFTQDPVTKDYYIVLQYANDLDLNRYLAHNCASIDWWQRISILDGIVKGIYELHKEDLIHHNLHTGNILVRRTRRKEVERISLRNPSSSVRIWISDSGLQGPAGSSNENNDLNSSSSPIDENTTSPDIPECWLDLMKKCWASKPEDRPNIENIMTITNAWNAERRKSLNLESKSSLPFSLIHTDHKIDENIVGQFMEAEKRRIERLNKGKQVERDDKPIVDEEISVGATESVNQDDDDNHQEVSMKSQLIDFIIEIPNENLNEIYGDSNSHHEGIKKEKVDSGYQREDQDDESLELQENINQIEDEIEPEKTIEEEKNLNKNIEDKQIEPIIVQDDRKKHVKIDDNQLVKQDNQDSPIKNGIEANSETGSKEINIIKEKEP